MASTIGKYLSVGKYFLKNQAISSIIKTREGGYWIATLKNGVFQIPNLHVWNIKGTELGLNTDGIGQLSLVKITG